MPKFMILYRSEMDASQAMGAEATAIDVSGYSTIEAEDKDTVHTLIENHPHLKMEGNSIDVLEMIPMPGM